MDALFLAFCAGVWVFVLSNASWGILCFGLLSAPFLGLTLSGVLVGLFGGVSTFSLLLSVGGCLLKSATTFFIPKGLWLSSPFYSICF